MSRGHKVCREVIFRQGLKSGGAHAWFLSTQEAEARRFQILWQPRLLYSKGGRGGSKIEPPHVRDIGTVVYQCGTMK